MVFHIEGLEQLYHPLLTLDQNLAYYVGGFVVMKLCLLEVQCNHRGNIARNPDEFTYH